MTAPSGSGFSIDLRFAEAIRHVDAAAVVGLKLGAEVILALSDAAVPLDEGTLSRSGAVDVDAAQHLASISYDTAYAVRQHEDMGNRHEGGRTAKYLEVATNTGAQAAFQVLAETIRRALA